MIQLLLALTFLLPVFAQAFDAGYVSFDLPEDQWICNKSKIRYVCQPKSPADKTQAIIILNAKIAGPEDNLKLYLKHLSQPKMLSLKGKSPIPSKVIYSDAKLIGPQQWVESLHDSSEVPDFYTLYLATRSSDLSILLQLSASKQQQKKFNPTFKKLIDSLRISQTFVAKVSAEASKYQQANAQSDNANDLIYETEKNESPQILGLSSKNLFILLGVFILLSGGLFIYYKKS